MEAVQQNARNASIAQTLLVRMLQKAHAGELAAALAYAGHWRSVKDSCERQDIHRIEQDELHHRAQLALWLSELGAEPDIRLERRMKWIGKTIGLLCHIGGWYIPMYGAGRLEASNIVEYETLAKLALDCERPDMAEELVVFAEVEWDHERYFRCMVAGHWMRRLLPLWKQPPARDHTRRSVEAYRMELLRSTGHTRSDPLQAGSGGSSRLTPIPASPS